MGIDDYLKAEKELAESLGWTDVKEFSELFPHPSKQRKSSDPSVYPRYLVGNPPDNSSDINIPDWVRSWESCGPLMVKYDVYPIPIYGGGEVVGARTNFCTADMVYFDNDVNMATRWAIVRETTIKLRALKPGSKMRIPML